MKILIEFLPVFVLFGLYKVYDLKVATIGFMVSLIVMLLWKYYQTRKWDKLLLITSVIGLVLGGATLALNNPIYIQHKPTLVYGLMALFFWISYQFYGKNWIEVLYSNVISLSEKSAKTLIWGTIFFFTLMLIVNVVLVLTLNFDWWITIKTWGFLAATLLFALWQGYIIISDKNNQEKNTEQATENNIENDTTSQQTL